MYKLSLSWEPKWVRVKLKFAGTEIVTCKDLSTNLLVCPLCVDIEKLCPEGKETNITVDNIYTFYTLEDLVNHMITHDSPKFMKLIKPVKEFGKKGGSS